MSGSDDRVAIFRKECRNYKFYLDGIERIDQQLEVLELRMQNVHSIDTERVVASGSGKERSLIPLIEKKEELLAQKQYYQNRIDWIIECLDNVPSPAYRTVIWKTYVQRESLRRFAEKYNVNSDLVYKMRKIYLEKMMTDEAMEKYQKITDDFLGKDDEEEKEEEQQWILRKVSENKF